MINLLAYDKKKELSAGRLNVIVRNYILLSLAGIVMSVLVLAGSYLVLSMTRSNAELRVKENNERIAEYAATQKSADTYRSNLAIAKQILDNQISYSNGLLKIGNALPDGVIIDSLSLDPKTPGSTMILAAHAKDRTTAIQLKAALEAKPELFSDVQFQNITFDQTTDEAPSPFPVAVSVSVIISKSIFE